MAVYVDDMEAPFGRMLMCHMTADTHAELVEMADRIGVARKWIQKAGHPVYEHFDIAKSKRAQAVKLGAVEVTYPGGLAEVLEGKKENADHYFAPELRCHQCGWEGDSVDTVLTDNNLEECDQDHSEAELSCPECHSSFLGDHPETDA